MATIPLGDFDQARVVPRADQTQVDTSPLNAAGRGAAALGEAFGNVASAAHEVMVKDKQEAEAVAGAKAANAATAFELQAQAIKADHADQLRRGGDYNTAPDALGQDLDKLEAPDIAGLSPAQQEAYRGHIANVRNQVKLSFAGDVVSARRDDGQRQFGTMIDLAGKEAGMPGADVAKVNANLQQRAGVMADMFGLDKSVASKMVQDRVDANWYNHAGDRFNAANGDLVGLETLRHDLNAKDGFYVDKIDPEKRIALTARVDTQIQQGLKAAQVEADKREKIAEQVVKDANEQAVSGLPPTPDMLASWQVAVKGTTQEQPFLQAVQQIAQVQQVRRLPDADQTAWLAARENALNTQGGSPHDLQLLNTVRAAFAHDAEERAKNPLQYLENMTGKPAAPLKLDGLATGDVTGLGTAIADRMASLKALKGQGYNVALKPLKAEEAQQLSAVLRAIPPDKALAVYAPLRAAAGSDEAYAAVMDQVAPNAPLKAYAGTLAVREGGARVADLVLRGDALLSGKDGKAFPMPPQGKFEQAFAEDAGNAYQGRPDAYKRDLAAARAVYAASAAQDGDTDAGTTFNDRRFADSMRAVRGQIAEVGGSQVTVPWGMDPTKFEDQVQAPIREALKGAGLDPDASHVSLMATPKEGRYVLMQGRFPIHNPQVQGNVPLFIDFTPAPPAPKPAKVDGKQALHVVPGLGL